MKLLAFALSLAIPAIAQSPGAPVFTPLPPIPFDTSLPVLRAHAETEKPFTVAGERAVVLGQQNGVFEAWPLPVKLLSHMTIEAEIEGYTVPIDVNQQAAEIEVRPDRTIITYSHIGFTVRQIMFSPASGASSTPGAPSFSSAAAGERVGSKAASIADQPGVGPIVLYEFDCVHPTDFTFRFTPELRWMWPERNEGVPGMEWIAGPAAAPNAKEPGPSGAISGVPLPNHGYYILHADYPDLAGAVTIPGAQPGILAPYQERPQVHPVELRLHIDPARDRGRLFPLLMAVGMNKESATNAALGATLQRLNESIPDLYKQQFESYKKLLANSVSIETPDKTLNEAFQWAVISIEQLKTKSLSKQALGGGDNKTMGAPEPALSSPKGPSHLATGDDESKSSMIGDETALVAGYYASADSARPGFGWFFGRDALYTLFAVNGYGNFALSRSELEFLIHRQRDDGKIMHEWSQTAAFIDWRQFPYMYAAADATPLFILAMADYVRSSGDVGFLTSHRDSLEKAWAFETDPAHDTDHDRIYDNSQGTGWVESWPGGMPHQEIYLALLDQQASSAMGYLETLLPGTGPKEAVKARRRAEDLANIINSEYYDPQKHCYAFSRNPDGSLDRTTTVYPALAWWSNSWVNDRGQIFNEQGSQSSAPSQTSRTTILEHPDGCLQQLAAHTLNTDWGLRDVSNDEKIYDGMSYHQGSVWPLFTGWAALAEYRGNQPLAGYQLLMENANLTKTQDLGAVTELLSGDYFVPFGRSTSHQLWSSAMVITPTLRGLFGLDIDAQTKTITVNPHLPANWEKAALRNLPIGSDRVDLFFAHGANGTQTVQLESSNPQIKLAASTPDVGQTRDGLEIQRAPIQIVPINNPPLPGSRTESARILNETYGTHKLALTIEGPAKSDLVLGYFLVNPNLKLNVTGAELNPDRRYASYPGAPALLPSMTVHFPPGEGWKGITVILAW
ncbi:amylo-alpha-1,6-glucosidase [Occallatibacter savannae]|uniref:amylo-alpha-1,6-glucosidase n=1 Tax=Occallatibacter savannae TaxID=1002691 RepID=UPI000D6933EB|nr:amylo-alpha-1,6-glucosidase [Occallatibacter savannae]